MDYEKAFDSVETGAVLESLQRCQVDWRYIEVLRFLYGAATISVQVQNQQSKYIQLRKGVRQRDVISPKLFTNAWKICLRCWIGKECALMSMARTSHTYDLPMNRPNGGVAS